MIILMHFGGIFAVNLHDKLEQETVENAKIYLVKLFAITLNHINIMVNLKRDNQKVLQVTIILINKDESALWLALKNFFWQVLKKLKMAQWMMNSRISYIWFRYHPK